MGIRAKLLSIAVIILIIGMAAEVVTSSYIYTTEYSQALQSRAVALGESLRTQLDRILSLGIPLNELVGFEKQCEELVERNNGIEYAMVFDLNGKVLFHSDQSNNLEETAVSIASGMEYREGVAPYSIESEERYQIVVPILDNLGKKIGAIVLGISRNVINERITHLVKFSAVVSFVVLSIAVALLLAALRLWVTKPATTLLDSILRLRRDERGFYSKITITSKGEIGQVSSAFNRLIEDLNTSHQTIVLHTEELESTVDKRTSELRELNEQLERDIAEREEMEQALRESEERFRAVVETAPEAIFIQTQGEFAYLNPAAVALFGATEENRLLGSPVVNWFHPECRAAVSERIRQVNEHRKAVPLVEEKILNCDGMEMRVEVSAVPFTYTGRDGALVFVRDITKRKQAEEERTHVEARLRQAQKMEALGTLAGGIAHDFNNILGIIIGYTEMADWAAVEGGSVRGDLQEVLTAAKRAKDLVQQILAFSRRSEQEKQPVQVGLIVKEAMKMLRASLPSTIDMKMDVASKVVVSADPTQIHQVLMNLCTNAAQAMRENGGVLEVNLADVRLGPEAIRPHSGLQPGTYARLTVRDTGQGIDPSILDRIFDPFFTTKELGVGTGLGLSVVHGIVESHGGAIELDSLPGQGATFRVFLPAMERAPLPETFEVAPPLPRGRERILVVDDEPALALAMKQMLERLGYDAACRTSGVEALEAFRHRSKEKPFDLVITDMTMPHVTGEDLARELLMLQPSLPIVLCTGFSEKMNADKARSLGIQGFLMKPMDLRELARTIREVLNERISGTVGPICLP